MRQNNDAGAGVSLSVSQLSPLGSGIRMPASVRVLTAAFSRPLPSLGHLILGPPHLPKPFTLFYGNLLKPLTLPGLIPQPSHVYQTPRSAGACFPTWLIPHPEEGGEVSSSCCRWTVSAHGIIAFPTCLLESDDSLFSLQQRRHLCLCACSDLSDSSRPHGLQPPRLLCPWEFSGKNTGVGCHFLLQGISLTKGSNPRLTSPALTDRFFTISTIWEALWITP